MKIRLLLAGAVLAVSALFSGQAAASVIDSDLGTVTAGDSGMLMNTFKLSASRYQDYNFTGMLDAKSRIAFSYSLTEGPASSILESAMGSLNAHDTDPYVIADISPDGKSGQVIITNFASVAANFTSFFGAFLAIGKNVVNVTYSVSAVPLPAALPLLGLGLAGLAGISYRRKVAKKV